MDAMGVAMPRDPLFQSLRWYDVNVVFTLNPLNWQLSYDKHRTYKMLVFGPVKVLVLHG